MSKFISLITAVISSFGFGIYFKVNLKKLPFIALGGFLGWFVYNVSIYAGAKIFFSAMLATASLVVYSEILARVLKAPANTVLIPSIVPLLPGRWLYEMMSCIISGNLQTAFTCGATVLQTILGISVGILLAMFVFYRLIRFFH